MREIELKRTTKMFIASMSDDWQKLLEMRDIKFTRESKSKWSSGTWHGIMVEEGNRRALRNSHRFFWVAWWQSEYRIFWFRDINIYRCIITLLSRYTFLLSALNQFVLLTGLCITVSSSNLIVIDYGIYMNAKMPRCL